jgi:hypothetical protein
MKYFILVVSIFFLHRACERILPPNFSFCPTISPLLLNNNNNNETKITKRKQEREREREYTKKKKQ